LTFEVNVVFFELEQFMRSLQNKLSTILAVK